jgi:hypothetical protein
MKQKVKSFKYIGGKIITNGSVKEVRVSIKNEG